MTPHTYITTVLNNLNTLPNLTGHHKLEEAIFKLLISKKYRKYSVHPDYLNHIQNAIYLNVKNDEPIKLTLVFGGYKLWNLKEAPEVDWAELISLIYYTKWLSPICAIYKAGVWLDFYSDDVILEKMNNISKNDTEAYAQSFKTLLLFIKRFIPNNLTITLHRVGDQYPSYNDFLTELQSQTKKLTNAWGGFPKLSKEQEATIELNVKRLPGQDDDPLWKEKVFLIHEAYSSVSKRRPYYRQPDKIFLSTRPIKDAIAIGTSKTSVVKFWIGIGALKKEINGFTEYIHSPKQCISRHYLWEQCSITGLELKNFNAIRVFED